MSYPGGGFNSGYPGGGYPPPGGYPGGYPPQGGYPTQGGYPPQGGYPAPGQPGPGIGFVNPGIGGHAYAPGPPGSYGANYDANDEVKGFEFDDATVRRGFIRKVYGILMIQLAITTAIVALTSLNGNANKLLKENAGPLFIVSFITTLVTMICMSCCGDVRRKAPMNFIFLFIFTIAESFLLSVMSVRFDPEIVLSAAAITVGICFALTLFSFQTKIDFTGMGTYLFVAVIVFMLAGLIMMFFPMTRNVRMVFSSIGVLLFSAFLVYDTQIMLGGKHKMAISPEEYIFAALNLYLDIIQIFMYILSILGDSRD